MSSNERADPTKPQSPPESAPTAKQDKTETNGSSLALAKRLLKAGIPVVLCTPCPGFRRPGKCPWHPEGDAELHRPKGWNTVTADQCDLSGFVPGVHTLAMVSGHGIDVVDVDTKAGGSVKHLPPFKSYGTTRTPSDGEHYPVPSSNHSKVSPFDTLLGHVGDYAGGRRDGTGRMLVYLPGSTRPKYPGGSYTEEVEWDVEACLAAEPDPALVAALEAAGADDTVREEYIDDSPVRPVEDGVHPEAEKGVKRALDRLDALPAVWSDGDHWDEQHHKVACILRRYANSNWTGYTLDAAEADYRAHARTDERWGEAKVDEKWEAAGDTVRGGGMEPPYREFADEPLPSDIPARRSDGEEWFLYDILPTRAYGVLDGPIGGGKSSLLGHVVARVAGKGFRVRYCVEDEPLATARHRLELLGADLNLVEFSEVPDLTTQQAIVRYARDCRAAGVDLVVFDLLQSANLAYEENKPEKVKLWTSQLVKHFCRNNGVGVLGTHHWNNNTKAGSALARQSGAGAISAKSEFHWSVASSNDRTEQVWTVHARRRITYGSNRWLRGTRHFVEESKDEYEPELRPRYVFTVDYEGDAGERTAKHVADDAARDYAESKRRVSSKEAVLEQADVLGRFLSSARKRVEVDKLLYWLTGVEYGEQTVLARLRDIGAVQCTDQGVPMEKGKFWIVLSEFEEN